MAHPIASQIHHNRNGLNHNPPQSLNPNHHVQHDSSMHNNLNHETSNSQDSRLKHNQDNDGDVVARKKRNADAQAAFRQRRQTYIRSLEETVKELKRAVSEMELIVKTTSHEAKAHRHQVESLKSKLAAYESGELKSELFDQQHCKCCKFATQHLNSRLPSSVKEDQHQANSLPIASTSATTINPSTDYPLSSVPSVLTSPNATPQEAMSREWPHRQTIPPIFQLGSASRSTFHNHLTQDCSDDPPHSTKSLDYPRNILHHHPSHAPQHPTYSRSNCDLSVFTSFGDPANSSIPHFYSVAEGHHGASAQPASHNSSPNGASNPLELGHHPTHLQPMLPHTYDRCSPLRQSNALASYPPLGPPHSFDPHHSGTLSSPRIWNSNHSNHTSGSVPHTGPQLNGSPKPELYSLDGTAADSDPSGFRMHHSMDERSIMRPADFLPSSYPIITSLVSPGGDTSPSAVGFKHRGSIPKRRRVWGNEKSDLPHDPHETVPNSNKTSGVGKLNGLPAKVGKCAQVVLEVTQSVSRAKEECESLTAGSSATIPTVQHSVSPNSTASNGFTESPDLSHDSSRFQRMKLNVPTHQSVSSAYTSAPRHSQSHDEQQPDHNYHRR